MVRFSGGSCNLGSPAVLFASCDFLEAMMSQSLDELDLRMSKKADKDSRLLRWVEDAGLGSKPASSTY